MSDTSSARLRRISDMIAAGRCVILDGGIGTELPQAAGSERALDEPLWGRPCADRRADAVLHVHARYLEGRLRTSSPRTRWGSPPPCRAMAPACGTTSRRPVHWMDVARRAVRLAHRAVAEANRQSAVAFSLKRRRGTPRAAGRRSGLLARLFADEPRAPD
jgi:hypothetical protein